MPRHEKIDYVEYPSRDLEATKRFFGDAFGWTFEDYGPDYIAFSGQGLDGGFYRSGLAARTEAGSALVVLYSNDLEATLRKVEAAGGTIVKPVFSFPGGRRFHFTEPGGNELAVWSEPREWRDRGTERSAGAGRRRGRTRERCFHRKNPPFAWRRAPALSRRVKGPRVATAVQWRFPFTGRHHGRRQDRSLRGHQVG